MSRQVMIVGASRGIGKELLKQYLDLGDTVVATVRSVSPDLQAEFEAAAETGRLHWVSDVDVGSDDGLKSLIDFLRSYAAKIDVVVHNAGILRSDRYPDIKLNEVTEQFNVNTLGPLRVVTQCQEFLNDGGKIGLVSSRVGSIADNVSSNNYGYRMSKAALNMLGSCLSLDLKKSGIAVALLHPGYVRTDMTSGQGLIDAPAAAAGMMHRIDELTLANSGGFWHVDGESLPW